MSEYSISQDEIYKQMEEEENANDDNDVWGRV